MSTPPGSFRPELRAPASNRSFHVVLVEPEIPPNTGNIARLCAATCCPLHLVGQLGFRTDEHAVRRAGLDYWHLVEIHRHNTLAEFSQALVDPQKPNGKPSRLWLFSSHARQSYLDASFAEGDALVFGKESVGLPDSLLAAHPEDVLGIPMIGQVRSLNLANAVSIALYEALRQLGRLEVHLPGVNGVRSRP